MITKILEVRDAGTFIPMIAIKTTFDNEAQRWLLRRAGYDTDGSCVILIGAYDCKGACDPYDHKDSRTRRIAHLWIRRHFDELKDGDVVDVEFIEGEVGKPKISERFEDLSS